MKTRMNRRGRGGFTLPEAVIVACLLGLTSLSTFMGLRTGRHLMHRAKLREAAVAAAQEQIEMVRNVEYWRVGRRTSDGMGFINAMVIKTGDFYRANQDMLLTNVVMLAESGFGSDARELVGRSRVFVDLIDDPWDGKTNTSYKRATAIVQWSCLGEPQEFRTATLLAGESGYDYETDPSTDLVAVVVGGSGKTSKTDKPKSKKKSGKSTEADTVE
jgi:type II secretory pathway pseudopilin PulG